MADKQQPKYGKGDTRRPENFKQFEDNWDLINWGHQNNLEDCPNCPNQGWYPVKNSNNEWEQVQCEWCWTNAKSRFLARQN